MLDHSTLRTLPGPALKIFRNLLAETVADLDRALIMFELAEKERARLDLARTRWILATAQVRAQRAVRNHGIVRAFIAGTPAALIAQAQGLHPAQIRKIVGKALPGFKSNGIPKMLTEGRDRRGSIEPPRRTPIPRKTQQVRG